MNLALPGKLVEFDISNPRKIRVSPTQEVGDTRLLRHDRCLPPIELATYTPGLFAQIQASVADDV